MLLGIGFIVNIRILSHWTTLWFPSVRVTCSVSHDLREREAVPVEEKKPDGVSGVKLMVLDNVCYNIYERNTYVFSADKTYMNKKRIPDSESDVVV